MKNYKVLLIVNIILIIYFFFLSVGYAFFSESLTINGVAKTVDFYSGTVLPNEGVKRDTTNNRYYTISVNKDKLFYQNDSWTTNEYNIIYKKLPGIRTGKFTTTFVVTIKNPTVLKYTNGVVSSSIVTNNSNRIKNATSTLSKKEVLPGENVDVSITITADFPNPYGWNTVKTTVSYNLQNSTKYFDIYVKYQYGW